MKKSFVSGQLWEPCEICEVEPVCMQCLLCLKHCQCVEHKPLNEAVKDYANAIQKTNKTQ